MSHGVLLMCLAASGLLLWGARSAVVDGSQDSRFLPEPALKGGMSLEEVIQKRRSVREFTDEPLTLRQIAQLCWAGQGITDRETGRRTAPSAGALYPMELYVVTSEGVYVYKPQGHALERRRVGDPRSELRRGALDQEPIGNAPACFVITAVVERSARKYGARADRYCTIEAGHIAQNILLQVAAMSLGGVPIGAFDDDAIARTLQLPKGQHVYYLVPVGHPLR